MSVELYPTRHLMEQMAKRHISWAEIVEVGNSPEVVYGPDDGGKRVLQRGNLSIVVDTSGNVVTVLLRERKYWTNADVIARNLERS